jgi:hypothetical protein
MNTFALLDLALIDDVNGISPRVGGAFRSWMAPIYGETAHSVTPLLIDIEAAYNTGELDEMTALVNAFKPQLHASFLDTELDLTGVAQHLRQFIYVRTAAGDELTLRFADCAVLPALSGHLSMSQWATLTAPIARWLVHKRDGCLSRLPAATPEQQVIGTPLVLTAEQIAAIKDAMGVDRLLANLRNMRPAEPLGRSPEEAFRWASEARSIWLAAGKADDVLLLVFVRGVFETKGRILNLPSLPQMLANPDSAQLRRELRKLVEINSYESQR